MTPGSSASSASCRTPGWRSSHLCTPPRWASFDGLLILHAEDAHAIDTAPPAHGTHYADFLSSRPRRAEDLAIGQVIEQARRTGCRVHILHLSSADALPMIAAARAERVRLSVGTCPH